MTSEKIDTNKRWIRVTNKTKSGFVEFEFYVSDADLYVELILPEAAFKEFCLNNNIALEAPTSAVAIGSHGGLLKLVK